MKSDASDTELKEQLRRLKANQDQIQDFLDTCGQDSVKAGVEANAILQSLSYLQPYVTIALANLLVAHGSPDEAVDVMTQWLNLWRCARGEDSNRKQRPANCTFGPLPEADRLPEWFSIRAEFELNVLLYRLAGEGNITYRDFLRDHTVHFSDFVARPQHYDRRPQPGGDGAPVGISISEELRHCLLAKPVESGAKSDTQSGANGFPNIRATMLRSLLQNEDTLLRSELHFLTGVTWPEMENFHERGLALTRFRIDCIYPEQGEERKIWDATLADYKITSGLLALAIADRILTTASSADERNRADEIKNEGKLLLRNGYRLLKDFRDEDRKKYATLPWSERVFRVSAWEESCTLAERAMHQLNDANR
jgi:hypothetical protein